MAKKITTTRPAAAAPQTAAETIVEIALDELHDSPFNPRTRFDAALLAELAATMKPPHGRVEQPVVVRTRAAGGFELVYGHRRTRAARLAELGTIPAIVRELTDEQARRAQIVENVQREGNTPIEEADALYAMRTEHGASIEDLMKQTGKGRTYVYNRLRLAQAHAEVREAVIEGDLDAEIAQEIARRPTGLQPRAMRSVFHMSYRNAKAELDRAWSFDLSRARFDPLDIKLVPDAGGCDACKKRSDAEEVLVQEMGPNVCLDGTCYGMKSQIAREREERIERERQAAEAKKRQEETAKGPATASPPIKTWPFQTGNQRALEPAGGTDDDSDADDNEGGGGMPVDPLTADESAILDEEVWSRRQDELFAKVARAQRTTDDLRRVLLRELQYTVQGFGQRCADAIGLEVGADDDVDDDDFWRAALPKLTADQLGALVVFLPLNDGPNGQQSFNRKTMAQSRLAWLAEHTPVQTSAPTPARDPNTPDMFEVATA